MKRYFVIGVITFIILLVGGAKIYEVKDQLYRDNIKQYSQSGDFSLLELQAGEKLVQPFEDTYSQMNKIAVYLQHTKSGDGASVDVSILDDNGNVITSWDRLSLSDDIEEVPFVFFLTDEEKKMFEKGKTYYVAILPKAGTDGQYTISVPVYRADADSKISEWAGVMEIDGNRYENCIIKMETEGEGYDTKIINKIVTILLITLSLIFSEFLLFFIGKRLYPYKKYAGYIFFIIFYALILYRYKILMDVLALFLLFLASVSYGMLILHKWKRMKHYLYICGGTGFCVIGVIIYYLLAMGIGSKGLYFLVLIFPILKMRRELLEEVRGGYEKVREMDKKYLACLLIIFGLFLALGSAPIDSFDARAKHLPVTIYAAENGIWYDNIIEDIVAYSESTLLPYTYTTVLFSFGCHKALILLNVFLFFLLYGMSVSWVRSIYGGRGRGASWLWLVVYFTTPYMANLSIKFMVDFTALYIVMTLMLCIGDLNERGILRKLPVLAFLAGCTIFTKLTILPATLIMGVIVIGLISKLVWEEKHLGKGFFVVLAKRVALSVSMFFIPFIYSFARNWYMTGNPFSMTAYNHVFKSPYLGSDVFNRPYNNSGIADGIKSFWNIVFHTSNMVEAADGAMGYFLLLFILIPIVAVAYKKYKIFIWFLIMFAMLHVGGWISGNLRYNLFPIICVEALIITSVEILCLKLGKNVSRIIFVAAALTVLISNTMYISEYYNWKNQLEPNYEISKGSNKAILERVPQGSRVFAFNDELKGEFRGFYFGTSYRNGYIMNKIYAGEKSLEDFLRGFDYALFKKWSPLETNNVLLNEYLKLKNSDVWEVAFEDKDYILYEIKKDMSKELVYGDEQSRWLEAKEIANVLIDSEYDEYRVCLKLMEDENTSKIATDAAIEVTWRDEEDNLISYDKIINKVYNEEGEFDSGWLIKPDDAVRVTINLINTNDFKIEVGGVQVEGILHNNYLDESIKAYYNRTALK